MLNFQFTPATQPAADATASQWLQLPVASPERQLVAAERRFKAEIAALQPISLDQMNSVALLDRVESKYLLHASTLLDALVTLRNEYAVLEIDGRRVNRYRTLYFDTEDFALYHRHQAGALNRYKVRSREYVESQLSFLEVKHKTNKKRTVKSRVGTPALVTEIRDEQADFVDDLCPYAAATLAPRLWNHYNRVTLVGLHSQERLTVDLGLTFEWDGEEVRLPGLVIVEAKLPARRSFSPFVAWAAGQHLRATGFSKYCIGTSLLYPEVKSNHFKSTHRHVARLLQLHNYGESHATH